MSCQGNAIYFPTISHCLFSFQRILWTSVEASYKDLIVGSFDDGRIELYDTQMLINGET